MSDLSELIDEATSFVPILDDGDAATTADGIIDTIISALRTDPRFPKLTLTEWDLIFADLRREITNDIGDLIEGMADFNHVIDVITDAVEESENIKITLPKGDQS
jgi:hypothetical protein